MNAALKAQVKAVNEANAYAETLSKAMQDTFAGLVGQKVLTVNGRLMKRYAVVLPCHTSIFSVYFHSSDYSLVWCVKTCENWHEQMGPEGSCYHEVAVYVGDINNGVLTGLCKPFKGRSDYTVDEVLQKRDAYFAAEEAYSVARSNLFPFGEN